MRSIQQANQGQSPIGIKQIETQVQKVKSELKIEHSQALERTMKESKINKEAAQQLSQRVEKLQEEKEKYKKQADEMLKKTEGPGILRSSIHSSKSLKIDNDKLSQDQNKQREVLQCQELITGFQMFVYQNPFIQLFRDQIQQKHVVLKKFFQILCVDIMLQEKSVTFGTILNPLFHFDYLLLFILFFLFNPVVQYNYLFIHYTHIHKNYCCCAVQMSNNFLVLGLIQKKFSYIIINSFIIQLNVKGFDKL